MPSRIVYCTQSYDHTHPLSSLQGISAAAFRGRTIGVMGSYNFRTQDFASKFCMLPMHIIYLLCLYNRKFTVANTIIGLPNYKPVTATTVQNLAVGDRPTSKSPALSICFDYVPKSILY